MKKQSLVLFVLLLLCTSLQAQEYWDLEKCINYALDNNLSVKQAEVSSKMAEQNLIQAKGQHLPSLNAFGSNIYNFGQTIDPFTNQFATQRVRSNQFGARTSLNLFSGLSNVNTQKQREYQLAASRYDLDKARNDITLTIASAYLDILFNEELVEVARNQVGLTQKQLDRTQKLVNAGTLPLGNLYEVEAQLATEELNQVQAQNSLDLAYLGLKQLLRLDESAPMRIVEPEIEIDDNAQVEARPGQVYDKALNTLPELKSAEYQVMGAEKQMAAAKGNYYPSLTLNGSIGSGYSGLNSTVTSYEPSVVQVGTTANGEPVTRVVQQPAETQVKPFSDQLSDNFNQSVGVTLNIPIFNRFSVNTSVEQAKLSVEQSQLQMEQTQNDVKQTIEQAYVDAVSALKSYNANKKAVRALRESYSYMEKRYEVGMINAVDLVDSKTRLSSAESELLRAKYDYVFKLKILDFYQGKQISLK